MFIFTLRRDVIQLCVDKIATGRKKRVCKDCHCVDTDVGTDTHPMRTEPRIRV